MRDFFLTSRREQKCCQTIQVEKTETRSFTGRLFVTSFSWELQAGVERLSLTRVIRLCFLCRKPPDRFSDSTHVLS